MAGRDTLLECLTTALVSYWSATFEVLPSSQLLYQKLKRSLAYAIAWGTIAPVYYYLHLFCRWYSTSMIQPGDVWRMSPTLPEIVRIEQTPFLCLYWGIGVLMRQRFSPLPFPPTEYGMHSIVMPSLPAFSTISISYFITSHTFDPAAFPVEECSISRSASTI